MNHYTNSMDSKLGMRKTRIVCISDTHNQTPTLPKGDVLIHAGDMTNQGTYTELRRQTDWLAKADFEAKIVVAGNHDITLDAAFYAKEGAPGGRFHPQRGQDEQDVRANRALVAECPGVTYLCHEEAHVVLEGLGVHFNVFGSPYSLKQGVWAFGYSAAEAEPLWAKVPEHIDLLVTHGPPKGLCDTSKEGGEDGCPALRQTLDRVRPRLLVCGHRHEGRGCRVLHWDDSIHDKAENTRISKWVDPGEGSGRLSLVDLTGRKGKDAWVEDIRPDARLESSEDSLVSRTKGIPKELSEAGSCIVNAAVMAHSYGGPKHFNKPMVVDVYLPIY
jgi:Calcineurin-like phosphoesterase